MLEPTKYHLFKILPLIFITLIFLPLGMASIQINEIMYNPVDCSDSICEWVELYNPSNNSYLLNDCFFNNQNLGESILRNKSYLLLVKNQSAFVQNFPPYKNFFVKNNSWSPISYYSNSTNYPSNSNNTNYPSNSNSSNVSIPLEDVYNILVPIRFSLSNKGKNLILSGNSWCNDSFDYSNYTTLANGNNYSLEKNDQSSWAQSISTSGTPGYANSNFFLNDSVVNSSNKSNFLSNYSNRTQSISACDLMLMLNLNHVASGPYEFNFSISIGSFSNQASNLVSPNKKSIISVTGQIYDFYGNLIKEYHPWTNYSLSSSKLKTYSPNLNQGLYLLKFSIEQLSCNDSNTLNNQVTSLFAIHSNFQTNTLNKKTPINFSSLDDFISSPPVAITLSSDNITYNTNKSLYENTSPRENNFSEHLNDTTPKLNQYNFINFNNTLPLADPFSISIEINSLDNKSHDYSAYAYLYNGPVCYSCQNNTINRNDSIFSFKVIPDIPYIQKFSIFPDKNIAPTTYKIKVVFKKDQRKTFDEIINQITFIDYHNVMRSNITSNLIESSIKSSFNSSGINDTKNSLIVNTLNGNNDNNTTIQNNGSTSKFSILGHSLINSADTDSLITGKLISSLIYQSTGSKAKKIIPVFLILSSLIAFFYIWRK